MSDAERPRYIVSAAYDWAFFLLPPVVSLALGICISGSDVTERTFVVAGTEVTGASLCIGVLVQAHLVAVLLRSHGNRAVFALHRLRFILVPALVWLAIATSQWVAVASTVVATFWDVWHSGAQTFGFARIYDRNHGAPADVGRRLDFWLNQLLYAGPILAGVTLMDHLEQLEDFASVGAVFFTAIPARVQRWQGCLTWVVVAGGALFLMVYLVAQRRQHTRGYRSSPLKVYLLVATGACSIYTWGFNSWGEAFFIMNLFHAVQYLALIWATEHGHLMARLGLRGRSGKALTGVGFVTAALGYGACVELLVNSNLQALWAVTMTVSLMHFWYDGFIWSVVKKQV